MQDNPICAPAKGKAVAVLWSNFAGFHVVAVWQILQSLENLAAICPGLVVALKEF
jgi:hypothetical protein